ARLRPERRRRERLAGGRPGGRVRGVERVRGGRLRDLRRRDDARPDLGHQHPGPVGAGARAARQRRPGGGRGAAGGARWLGAGGTPRRRGLGDRRGAGIPGGDERGRGRSGPLGGPGERGLVGRVHRVPRRPPAAGLARRHLGYAPGVARGRRLRTGDRAGRGRHPAPGEYPGNGGSGARRTGGRRDTRRRGVHTSHDTRRGYRRPMDRDQGRVRPPHPGETPPSPVGGATPPADGSAPPGSGTHEDGHDHSAGHGHAAGHGHGAGDEGGHDQHAGHSAKMFADRFWWSLVLTIPVVVTSPMIMEWFRYDLDFPGVGWVPPVLGTVIFAYGGAPFLAGAVREARARQPGMMLLIGMAITVGFLASWAATLGWFAVEVWWELALLIVIMLLGHWLEMRAIGQAQNALAALAELLPDQAERVRDGEVEQVPLAELRVGDVVLVRPGTRVPADGTIVDGAAELDESMLTGESNPVPRSTGDQVVAASIATDNAIRVRVDAVGDDTALAGIQRLVAEAQASRSRSQVLADRAAALLFYAAVAAAAITVTAWALLGQVDAAVTRSVTVLIIACP